METMTIHPPDVKGAYQYFKDKCDYSTGPVEVSHLLEENKNDINIVDVRDAKDYEEGHIPGAVNLPRDEWNSLKGLIKEKTNILYCYTPTCHLAAKAGMFFASKGYPVMEMDGGWRNWKENNFPVENMSNHS